jgi:hypothetical protein
MNMLKIVKSMLLVGILSVIVVGGLIAQPQQRMRMSPEDRVKALKDSLSLDSTQVAKVLAIYKWQQDEGAKLREASQGDFASMRTAMTDLNTKTDDKIKGVLTDAQKKKYEEMIKNRPVRGPGMGGPRGN